MRVAIIGAGHWHLRIYLDNLLKLPGVVVVGISDPDAAVAQQAGTAARSAYWIDYREMCATVRPDFVIGLGYHAQMAETAHFLIDSGIPFAMEKPCGVTSQEVRSVAAHAREKKVFASVCFAMRASPMIDMVGEYAPGERVHYLGFKFVGGLMSRYAAMNADWVLERKSSFGGALLNLGIHCLDLAMILLGKRPEVVAASISNALGGRDVEDHAVVLLKAGPATAHIETGYFYPAGRTVFDMHFMFRTDKHYFVVENDHTLEIGDETGAWVQHNVPTSNSTCYPHFIRETLRRVEHGQRPLADMDDAAAALALVEAAYRADPL